MTALVPSWGDGAHETIHAEHPEHAGTLMGEVYRYVGVSAAMIRCCDPDGDAPADLPEALVVVVDARVTVVAWAAYHDVEVHEGGQAGDAESVRWAWAQDGDVVVEHVAVRGQVPATADEVSASIARSLLRVVDQLADVTTALRASLDEQRAAAPLCMQLGYPLPVVCERREGHPGDHKDGAYSWGAAR